MPVEDPNDRKIQGIFERRAQSLGGKTVKTVTYEQQGIVTEESNVGDPKINLVLENLGMRSNSRNSEIRRSSSFNHIQLSRSRLNSPREQQKQARVSIWRQTRDEIDRIRENYDSL
jgi:hypothetical protein